MTKTTYLYITMLLLSSCQGDNSRTNRNPPNTQVTKRRGTGGQDVINPHYHNHGPDYNQQAGDYFAFIKYLEDKYIFNQACKMKVDQDRGKCIEGGARKYHHYEIKSSLKSPEININSDITHFEDIMGIFGKKWDEKTHLKYDALREEKKNYAHSDMDLNILDIDGTWSMHWYKLCPYLFLPSIGIKEFAKRRCSLDLLFRCNPDLTPDNLYYVKKMGIDIYEVDEYGYNALYRAAYYGCYKVIPYLESRGLKWDINLNPIAKRDGNENCLIIWSYDIKATEIPRIEDEEKFLQIVEGVNNGEITEEKDKELIDYMDETSFKSPRIFLRQGVNHHWDYPDVIKCPGGLSLIEYCKKCDLRYFKRARFISYVINECKIKKNSVSEGL